MPPDKQPASVYRQEAARLRSMAESDTFARVRADLLAIARQYDVLAAQADDMAGQVPGRRLGGAGPGRGPR